MPKTTGSDDVDILPIYVNKNLLSYEQSPVGREYVVNEEVFRETRCPASEDALAEFEVYKMEIQGDMYCSTPSGSENGDFNNSQLNVSLQPAPNGYIVNNSCFLTWQQWHTLITPQVSLRLLQCVVCSQYCETDSSRDHVITVNHRMALEAYPPLEKFDLSIIRKIRDQYHCAVCNELFDSEFDHSASKIHEGNLLFAINKASDLLDNSVENNDNDKIDTYHFKTHAMNSTINDNESVGSNDNYNYVNFQNNYYFDDYEEETPAFTGLSYATMAKKPKANTQTFIDIDLGNKKVTVRYDSWHMVISPKPNRFWCMVCRKFDHLRRKKEHCSDEEHLNNLHRCKVVDAYDEYFIRQVDDKLYHCGHCNNLQMIHEMEDHVETNHPRKKPQNLVSEAKNIKNSPAKNTNKLQTLNETDGAARNVPQGNKTNVNGAKNVPQSNKIETNTAMKNIPQVNTVIKKISYEEFINSFNKTHNVNKTSNVAVTKANIDRSVNTNIVNDKIPVINAQHSNVTNNNKIPFIVTRNDNHHVTNTRNDNHHVTNTRNDNHHVTNTRNDNHHVTNTGNDNHHVTNTGNNVTKPKNIVNNNDAANTNNNNIQNGATKNEFTRPLLDSITIYPFGYNITLPWFSYNIVCKRPTDYYCGLCDMVCQEADIVNHMYEVRHLELLQRTPFIAPFSYNLIRAIRDALHCAICNLPIAAAKIYTHIQDPQHIESLNKARQTPMLPPIGVKMPDVPEKLEVRTPNEKLEIQIPNNVGPILSPNTINNNTNNTKRVNVADIENNVNNVYKATENNNNIESTEEDEIEDIVNNNDYEDTDTGDELNRTFDSIPSEEASFDEEEHVYLKLKNTYIKISSTSYNTLVHIGDGSRYCFVCSARVEYVELQKHVDGRTHLENIGKYMFLDKYEDHLLRQIYLMYHCAICNVIISRKELKAHLEWPTHALQNVTLKNIKKTRKTEIKGGVKQIVVSTQKENIYLHENEPKIKVCLNVEVTDEKAKRVESKEVVKEEFSKKNKIIIFNDNVLKLSWESWHAISKIKNGYKCNLCQRELKSADIDVHCTSEWHRYGLDKPFEKQYAPALIRKINDSTLNCVFCNTEVSNKEHLVTVHVNGKKHQRIYEEILRDSSQANTYTDCHDDVLML